MVGRGDLRWGETRQEDYSYWERRRQFTAHRDAQTTELHEDVRSRTESKIVAVGSRRLRLPQRWRVSGSSSAVPPSRATQNMPPGMAAAPDPRPRVRSPNIWGLREVGRASPVRAADKSADRPGPVRAIRIRHLRGNAPAVAR